MSKLGFFARHAEAVRKLFGVLILCSVLAIAAGFNPSLTPEEMEEIAPGSGLQNALPSPYPAPEFHDIQAWLNSSPTTMENLKGHVVLIDFWTYSCINCVRTLPYLTKWDAKYRSKGLIIIGVSAPEFEFEKNPANVMSAMIKNGIKYPVALDNNLETWKAFRNQYWPAHYLINRKGQVVYTHSGEGNYAETEHNIRVLLGLEREDTTDEALPFSTEQSPETYLGTARRDRLREPAPEELALNDWTLKGDWSSDEQKITSTHTGDSIAFHFKAKRVYLVMGTANGTTLTAKVGFNGETHEVKVPRHALYSLLELSDMSDGIVTITADGPGLEAYAFTFGS